MNEILVATDLDGTLIGDDEALQKLNDYLTALREHSRLKLAYVTGRSMTLYQQLAAQKSLITPDALVTAVGTEIYWNGTETADNWPVCNNWNRLKIVQALSEIEQLATQPESEQRPFKISYFLGQNNDAILAKVKYVLEDFDVDIVYSQDLYLDILPKHINKGSALMHLAIKWDIDSKSIFACGDSGNDIDMLKVSKSIVVGNAKQELLDWARHSSSTELPIYIAKHSFAAGILEGLAFYNDK
ncbi:sucrose-phosphate phosphatase [Candidatus Saccharibacteria bacterium]|nr:sucrose-phosphate phosphatase [Candidatus Saccharibacteria bacterium]